METIFLVENNLFKIEGVAPKDKMKLFLNVEPKISEQASILFIGIDVEDSELEKNSNQIKDELNLQSITHTNSYKSANEIINEYEIDVVILNSNAKGEKLNLSSELIIGGKEEFNLENLDFKQTLKEIFCYLIKKENVTESIIYSQIIDALEKQIDTKRCNHDVVKDFTKELVLGNSVSERRILKGKEPIKGKDGKLLLLSKKYTGVPEVTFDALDTAHYHSLRLFDNIRIGQKVARIYKPKPGKPGLDVLGNEIEAEPGNEYTYELCENLEVQSSSSKPYLTVISKSHGYITENNGNIKLHSEFVVDGDLDLRYGNINFVGSVRVTGNVLRGFSIKANAGIKVNGEVEEANLQSANGSIEIDGYCYGGRNSIIRAGIDFFCDIAHELNVEAKNNIIIKKESIDSNLYSQGATLIDSGTLIGGQVLAAKGIQVFEAGNDLEKETKIYLASSLEATKEYGDLIQSIEKHTAAIELLNAHLGPLSENPTQINSLIGGFKTNMEELIKKKNKIQESLDVLNEKKERMISNATYDENQKVNFIHNVFAGIKILCKEAELTMSNERAGPVSFSYDEENEEIKEIDFEKIEFKE